MTSLTEVLHMTTPKSHFEELFLISCSLSCILIIPA